VIARNRDYLLDVDTGTIMNNWVFCITRNRLVIGLVMKNNIPTIFGSFKHLIGNEKQHSKVFYAFFKLIWLDLFCQVSLIS